MSKRVKHCMPRLNSVTYIITNYHFRESSRGVAGSLIQGQSSVRIGKLQEPHKACPAWHDSTKSASCRKIENEPCSRPHVQISLFLLQYLFLSLKRYPGPQERMIENGFKVCCSMRDFVRVPLVMACFAQHTSRRKGILVLRLQS